MKKEGGLYIDLPITIDIQKSSVSEETVVRIYILGNHLITIWCDKYEIENRGEIGLIKNGEHIAYIYPSRLEEEVEEEEG